MHTVIYANRILGVFSKSKIESDRPSYQVAINNPRWLHGRGNSSMQGYPSFSHISHSIVNWNLIVNCYRPSMPNSYKQKRSPPLNLLGILAICDRNANLKRTIFGGFQINQATKLFAQWLMVWEIANRGAVGIDLKNSNLKNTNIN